MDIFVLIGLAAFGFALLGPIGFFVALGARGRAARLETRVATLEARLASGVPASAVSHASPLPPAAGRDSLPQSQPGPLPIPQIPLAPSPRPQTAPAATFVLPPPRVRRGFEETLGTRWTVWVGGLALGLGALLLVRYSIEQGFFGPRARVGMALALAAVLTGAGEWLRRREPAAATSPTASNAYIPGVLTACGAVAAFGAIYAAHALYGFIGPAGAFVCLGAVGLACMVAAALHGPALAGLGLVGAMASPLLVQSQTPDPWPVVLYLAVVAGSAYALSRLRRWLWLAIAAAIGAMLWGLALVWDGSALFADAALAHATVQTALGCLALAILPHLGGDGEEMDPIAAVPPALLALVTLVAVAAAGSGGSANGLWWFAVVATPAILAAAGVLSAPATACVGVAGLFILGVLRVWPDAIPVDPFDQALDARRWMAPVNTRAFAIYSGLGSLGLGAIAAQRLTRDRPTTFWPRAILAGTMALIPLGAVTIAWLRIGQADTSYPFAALAAGLAAVFTLVATILRARREASDIGLGAAASAALAALALACVFALSGGTLTIALAIGALGAAYVSTQLQIPALRWCVAAAGVAVAGRLAWEPRIVGADLSPTPIFNWLLAGYGVPAVCFALAARLMRRAGGEDAPVRVSQSLAVLLSAFLLSFEIRHWLYGGDIYSARTGFVEQGLFATSAFGFAAVTTQLDAFRRAPVLWLASLAFGAVAFALTFAALGLWANPVFTAEPVVGGPLLNALLIGYAAPALAAFALAVAARNARPAWYVAGARVSAIALIFGAVSLEVRRVFQGPNIEIFRRTSQPEFYTYSAVWLAFGLALLAWGLWRGAREARLASAFFVTMTVLKVFIFDLEGLEGLWRALSFIGLGIVLIGIGLVYQKLVFARPPSPDPGAQAPAIS